MVISDRLRQLREEKKLSQGDIEIRTGLLRCYISRVENGHTVPSIETLEKLARAPVEVQKRRPRPESAARKQASFFRLLRLFFSIVFLFGVFGEFRSNVGGNFVGVDFESSSGS